MDYSSEQERSSGTAHHAPSKFHTNNHRKHIPRSSPENNSRISKGSYDFASQQPEDNQSKRKKSRRVERARPIVKDVKNKKSHKFTNNTTRHRPLHERTDSAFESSHKGNSSSAKCGRPCQQDQEPIIYEQYNAKAGVITFATMVYSFKSLRVFSRIQETTSLDFQLNCGQRDNLHCFTEDLLQSYEFINGKSTITFLDLEGELRSIFRSMRGIAPQLVIEELFRFVIIPAFQDMSVASEAIFESLQGCNLLFTFSKQAGMLKRENKMNSVAQLSQYLRSLVEDVVKIVRMGVTDPRKNASQNKMLQMDESKPSIYTVRHPEHENLDQISARLIKEIEAWED